MSNKVYKFICVGIVCVALLLSIDRLYGGARVISSGNDGLSRSAIEYYIENTEEAVKQDELDAKVLNFGCHREIHVFQNGELVMRTGLNRRGQIYQID